MLNIINQLLAEKIGQTERLEYIRYIIEIQKEMEEFDKEYLYSLVNIKETKAVEPKSPPALKPTSKVISSVCALYDKKLGLMSKKTPKKIWDIPGKLCKECYKEVQVGISIFDATYKRCITIQPNKIRGSLIVKNIRNVKCITFHVKKSEITITMLKETISAYEKIPYDKGSLGSNLKSKLGKDPKINHLHLQFMDHMVQDPIFEIKELERVQ